MNFFNFDLKKILIIGVLVALPLISVNMQQRAKDKPWVFMPFYYFAGVTQSTYSNFSSGVRSTSDLYLNLIDIKKNNRLLNQEIAELKAQLGELAELKLENLRLGQLLEFKKKTDMNLLPSRVIGKDLLTEYDSITIDRGEKHNIKKGMGVLTINGVVGYVIEVEPSTSKVLIITDRYAVVDGIVQRSRARGLVQGHTKNSCTLTFLRRSDDVQIGDMIVTSGIDNYFPQGFPIGTVTRVETDEYGLGQDVDIQPVINHSNLEEVFVVLNANNQNFEALAAQELEKQQPPKEKKE